MTNAPDIDLARVYDDARASRGARLLVDRVWPRGIGKDDLDLDDWIREVAPTTDLRKWFGHRVNLQAWVGELHRPGAHRALDDLAPGRMERAPVPPGWLAEDGFSRRHLFVAAESGKHHDLHGQSTAPAMGSGKEMEPGRGRRN